MSFSNLTARERFLIATLIPVLIAVAIYGFVLRPQLALMSDNRQQLSEIEQSLTEAERRARILPALRGEVRKLEWDMQELYRVVPTKSDVPGLLAQISGLARQHNVELVRFVPGTGCPDEGPGNAYGIRLDLTVMGTNDDMRSFMRALQSRGRLIEIKSIRMVSDESLTPVLSVRISARSFYF